MTQIRSLVQPTRRPGELGVHSLNTFVVETPDLGMAERFYTSFGLDLSERGRGFELR